MNILCVENKKYLSFQFKLYKTELRAKLKYTFAGDNVSFIENYKPLKEKGLKGSYDFSLITLVLFYHLFSECISGVLRF